MRTLLILFLTSLPLAAQTATVEGAVTDTIRNKPVPRATVLLRSTTRTGSPPLTDVYRTETDGQGRFLIQGVPPGNYRAQLSRQGFVFRQGETDVPPLLTFTAGQHAVLPIQMTPTGVIAGRVVDADGESVRNASVEAMQYAFSPNGRQLSARRMAATNDRGEYRLYDLPPGSYYVRANAQPPMTSAYSGEQVRGAKPVQGFVATYYPSVRDSSEAAPLDVAAGAELRDVVMRLFPERVYAARVKLPAPPGDMSRNIPMIYVERRDASVSSAGSVMGYGSRMSRDASAYTFEFPSLLPGPYVLTAIQTDAANRDKRTYAREFFDVADGDIEIAGLSYAPGADISGKVKVEGDAPFALQAMRVSLQPRSLRFQAMAGGAVGADGTFAIHDLGPDVYTVRPGMPAGAYLKSVKMGDKELTGLEVDLSGGGAGEITILLGTDGARIEGPVVNTKEAPAAGRRVTLVPDGSQRGRADRLRIALTNDQGNFEFRDVPPGEYRLFAWEDAAMGAPQDPEFRRKFEDQSVAVTVEPNSRKAVPLKTIVTTAK